MPRKVNSKAKAQAGDGDKENDIHAADVGLGVLAEKEIVPQAAGKGRAALSRKATSVTAATAATVATVPTVPTVPTASLADELEEMTKKMNTMSLEKEKAVLLLKERDALLEQKNAEELRLQGLLEAKELEQKKLAEKIRKLQKLKEFQPTIDLPMPAPATTKESKKDLKHLKRPLTPFLRWAKEYRVQVRKDHPEATFAEISKILGDKWKTVSDEEKKPYDEQYKIEKDVYLKMVGKEKREVEALKIYEEEHNKKVAADFLEQYLKFKSKEDNDEGKKKKKEKDPSKPKQPTSAFFVFSNERRPKMLAENMKIPEIGRKLGEEWKALDEGGREPYEKVAAEDKSRYATELEAYKLKKAADLAAAEEQTKEQDMIHKAQGMQLLKQREQIDQVKKSIKEEKLKKKRVKAEPADPNRPKKPLTSYILFVVENRKLIQQEKPGINSAEVTATLAVRWQELPEAEKQVWTDKAAIARESYKVAMDEYNKKQTVVAVS